MQKKSLFFFLFPSGSNFDEVKVTTFNSKFKNIKYKMKDKRARAPKTHNNPRHGECRSWDLSLEENELRLQHPGGSKF